MYAWCTLQQPSQSIDIIIEKPLVKQEQIIIDTFNETILIQELHPSNRDAITELGKNRVRGKCCFYLNCNGWTIIRRPTS